MKLIVNAVQEGREDDLTAAGLRVTKRSARETLDDKLNDPQINQNVFGLMTSDEQEVMKQLSDQVAADLEELESGRASSSSSTSSSSSSDIDLDPSIFAELQAEAYETLYSLRNKGGSGMAALLDDAGSSGNGFGATQREHRSEFSDLNGVLDNIMVSRSPTRGGGGDDRRSTATTTATTSNEWSPAVGVEQELPFGSSQKQASWTAAAPPAVSPGSRLEIEEAADEEDDDAAPSGPSAALSSELPISPKTARDTPPAVAAAVDGGADKSLLRDIIDVDADLKQRVAAEPESAADVDAQATFAQLLKITMEQQTDAASSLLADLPDDAVRGTVDAITQGDLAALDMKSLLGEALTTLTEQLGIDMKVQYDVWYTPLHTFPHILSPHSTLTPLSPHSDPTVLPLFSHTHTPHTPLTHPSHTPHTPLTHMKSELQNNPQTMGDIQSLMAANMADLAKNMEELDKESLALFEQLGTLEADLRKETAAFDEQKQMELGELLQSQNQMQDDFAKSRVKVQASTEQLENMMKTLEEDADALTCMALFPVKSVDKKVAFIVGLALVFKVPFDLSRLVAVGSTDFTDMLTILTQTGLCLACLNHYGLLSALGKKSNTFTLPPPPPPSGDL